VNAAELIQGRSPGERQEAYLTKIKQMPAVERAARAKPRTKAKPDAPLKRNFTRALADAAGIPDTDSIAPFGLRASDVAFSAPAVGGSASGLLPSPAFGPFGGGAGGGGDPGRELIPPAPVPEPDIWLTLIFGFGSMGIALRRAARRPAYLGAASL